MSVIQEQAKRSLSSREILHIAEEDAVKAYGDLSEFQITLFCVGSA